MTERSTPPRLPGRIFRFFSNHAFTEDLLGDAEELYHADLEKYPV